jgi:hypothetical protein
VGGGHELLLLEHRRTPQGLQPTLVRSYTIDTGRGTGITSGKLVPMQSGTKILFSSVGDLGWLDLEQGTSGTWRTGGVFTLGFAKLDETHVMLDPLNSERLGKRPWSFDIAAETVAPMAIEGERSWQMDIGDRVGYLRRSEQAWFGDAVQAGEAIALDKVVAEAELEKQLAKLQAQTRMAETGIGGPTREPVAMTGIAPTRPKGMAIQASLPGLAGVPVDARVHMIGVYESRGRSTGGASAKREITVVARASSQPMVLVLASYEAVDWSIRSTGGRIAAVLLSGGGSSSVSGVGNVPVLRIGSDYAYSSGGAEYGRLRQVVAQYTGPREIRSFQGMYAGSEFSVGGD